jgi:hypothetical protein
MEEMMYLPQRAEIRFKQDLTGGCRCQVQHLAYRKGLVLLPAVEMAFPSFQSIFYVLSG